MRDEDVGIVFGAIIVFLLIVALGFMSGVSFGSSMQLKDDATESINSHPGADWQKAVIDAKTEMIKQGIK